MGIVFGLGGLIALIALMLKSAEVSGGPKSLDVKTYAKGLPESVKLAILRESKGEATKTELEAAASAAYLAGYEQLALALTEKVKTAKETTKISGVPSPLPAISHDAWTKFIKLMGPARAGTVGPKGQIGVFQMSVKRLVDMGLMKSPRLIGEGPKKVWTAEWTIDRNKFMGDTGLQYKVFAKSMEDYRRYILEHYRSAIGTSFEGQLATMSGLLAVAHHTGAEGLAKWLKNDPPRSKFKATAAAYKAANGIF